MITQDFLNNLYKSKDFLIIVEGKKDKLALEQIGFQNIFILNEPNKSLNEKVEHLEIIAGKQKVCILTDFDKKGKQLYLRLKSELASKKLCMNNSLRHTLLKSKITHIEGLSSFLEKNVIQ